jgi:cytoskeleton protein RodZ
MATLGETLKAAREAAGYSTSQAAEATRIKVQHIEELERNDFTRFAAPIYGKGFIKLYAEFLNLDPSPMLAEYALAGKPALDPTLKPPKGARRKELEPPRRAPTPAPPAPPAAASDRRPAEDEKGGLLFDAQGEPAAGGAKQQNERRAGGSRSIGDLFAGVAAQMRGQVAALKPAPRAPEPVSRTVATGASASPVRAPGAPAAARAPVAAGSPPEGSGGAASPQPGGASRSVALIIGVLLIVILLVSGVSRCVRAIFSQGDEGRGAHGDAPMVFTHDPPEPYAD